MARAFLLAAIGVSLAAAVACDGHSVQLGMTEDAIVRMMGQPTAAWEAPNDLAGWFADDEECIPKLARVVLYDRYIRADVFVGLDNDRVVRCTRTTYVAHLDFSAH